MIWSGILAILFFVFIIIEMKNNFDKSDEGDWILSGLPMGILFSIIFLFKIGVL